MEPRDGPSKARRSKLKGPVLNKNLRCHCHDQLAWSTWWPVNAPVPRYSRPSQDLSGEYLGWIEAHPVQPILVFGPHDQRVSVNLLERMRS
jgi:hypothetical protein